MIFKTVIYDANDFQNGEGPIFKAPPCDELLFPHWRLHCSALCDGCSICFASALFLLVTVHPNATEAATANHPVQEDEQG